MKSLLKIAGIIPVIMLIFIQLAQCKDNESETLPKASLSLDRTSVSSAREGDEQFIIVTALNTDWDALVPDVDKGWCKVSKLNGNMKVVTTENTQMKSRNTTITISAKADASLSKSVLVTQLGSEPVILTDISNKSLEITGGNFDVLVTSNLDYTFDFNPRNPVWIRKIEIPEKKSDGTVSKNYRFEYDTNDSGKERSVTLTFKEVNGSKEALVYIKQTHMGTPVYNSKTPIHKDIESSCCQRIPSRRGKAC